MWLLTGNEFASWASVLLHRFTHAFAGWGIASVAGALTRHTALDVVPARTVICGDRSQAHPLMYTFPVNPSSHAPPTNQ